MIHRSANLCEIVFQVRVQDALQSGVRVQNVLQPGGQSTPVTYKYATEEQIEKLINVSSYYWQVHMVDAELGTM